MSHTFFKSIYQHTSDKVCVLDQNNCIMYTNDSTRGLQIGNTFDPHSCGKSKRNRISRFTYQGSDYKVLIIQDEVKRFTYKRIFESFQDLYVRIDLKGTIKMVSPSVKDMLGYDAEAIIGVDITNYYLYTVKVKYFFKKLIKFHKLKDVTLDLIAKDGTIIHFNCNLRMLINEQGTPYGIDVVCRDISKITKANIQLQIAKDELEQALQVKEQFLANMSHEVRTPMNGIIGIIELLQVTSLSKKQKNYLATIESSSMQLLNLLNSIIDISKAKIGTLILNEDELDIETSLNDISDLFAAEFTKKKVNFTINHDTNIPKNIIADNLKIFQVLSNLVSNAIKFSHIGGNIKLSTFLIDNNTIKIEINDEGIGIKNEYHDYLFSIFSQVDSSQQKKHDGAGLGLAISKELVEVMKGEIGLESTYGKGSKFWFTLRYKNVEKRKLYNKNQIKHKKNINKVIGKTFRVQVVDDNPTNRQVASEMLNQIGYQVDQSDNGKDALRKSRSNNYDFILMDIQMPDMDGIITMKAIKKFNKDIQVIAMTAYSSEDEKHYLKMGFDGYISKPITMQSVKHLTGDEVEKIDKPIKISKPFLDMNVNIAAIIDLISYIGEDQYWQVYDTFTKTCAILKPQIENAYAEHNNSIIKTHAHTLYGDASTLGLTRLGLVCKKIEEIISNDNNFSLLEPLKKLYLELEKLPKVKFKLKKILKDEQENTNS